nr:hypothetical protein [Tanacetum cinerariifolium]
MEPWLPRCHRPRTCQPPVLPRQAKLKRLLLQIPLRPQKAAREAVMGLMSSQGTAAAGDPESGNASFASAVGSPDSRMWVIGRGLRLAVMKCGESLELRQAFADVVSAGIAKGMSEGLRHGVEHRQAQLSLESIEAYDPEAEAKY